jgi:CRP-like cAMP-binding protein
MISADTDLLELLNLNTVFSGLNPQQIESLLNIAIRKTYSKNQPVFEVDHLARYLYIVESGSFTLNLRNHKVKMFSKGDIFGEVGIINEQLRTGTIRALEESSLIAINGHHLFDQNHVETATALKVLRELAKLVTYYLRSREQISTQELIEHGETEYVEFKSSMRWNAQTNNTDRMIEQPIIRTLGAFLNSKGGTLLVGVRDDGKILGIGRDRFENHDKMLLHLTGLIKLRIDALHMKFIRFEVEPINNEHVLRVDVEPATMPAYVKEGKSSESFYVRTGPSTTHLMVSKIFDYIRMRF